MIDPREILKLPNVNAKWAIGTISAIVFLCGLMWQHAGLLGGGAVVLCLVFWSEGLATLRLKRKRRKEPDSTSELDDNDQGDEPFDSPRVLLASTDDDEPPTLRTEALVEDLIAEGRYALLLHPDTSSHLDRTQIVRAVRMLDEKMAVVPAGNVLVGPLAEFAASGWSEELDPRVAKHGMVEVEAVYLDRHAVTNREFQQFVDSGGYEKYEFWLEEALLALLDFVDQTDQLGPRFWVDGHYLSGEENLPVVGISWYEACAYARWAGKRLPTDAEWTKAGAWPVESAPGRIAQRRYPWGESFDVRRANLWASGHQGPRPVNEYPGGMSVGGVHQLVGNVWEWTASPLIESVEPTLHVPETMKCIRGGAFDTYFESQATCHYQSGDFPLARRRNIGVRLALSLSAMQAAEEAIQKEADAEARPEPIAACG